MAIEDKLSNKLCSIIDDAKNDMHHRIMQSMPEINGIIQDYAEKYLQEEFLHLLNKFVGGPALVLPLPENISYGTFGHLIKWHSYEANIAKVSQLAEKEILAFLENRYKELRESPTQYGYKLTHNAGRCDKCSGVLKMIFDDVNLDTPSFTICFKCENIRCVTSGSTVESG